MFGKDDLVDNLSRDLDRARLRRDALASEATTLTAQIAEIEARLSEEKTRRERERVLSEIEAIRTRIKQAAGAFAPVVDGLSRAIESASAVVPEARDLNSFIVSVATEIDTHKNGARRLGGRRRVVGRGRGQGVGIRRPRERRRRGS